MMSLEGLFVLDITAFADPSRSGSEAMILKFDPILEASDSFLVGVHLAVAAYLTVAASEQAAIEFVTTFAAVVAAVATAEADLLAN